MNDQRKTIAWCGNCGNISIDGINFFDDNDNGYLTCAHCSMHGPFKYIQEVSIEKEKPPNGG